MRFLLYSFIILVFVGIIYAQSPPVLPASYYGTVEVEGGGVLNNVKLVAKIDGKVVGEITITNNKFGGESFDKGKLLVQGTPDDEGKDVEFYIGKYKVKETVKWHSGDIKEIKLTFPKDVLNLNNNVDQSDNQESSSSVSGNTNTESNNQTQENYPNVAKDIKSEKIKQFVYKAKLIIGSDVDGNLSAKKLKNNYDKVTKELEIKEDCILVGGPVANPTTKKYIDKFSIKVTNDYPGKNKGVIQKQTINGHTVILLAGSDRWGTKAAVEYFKTLDDIPEEPIFVEWKDGKAVKIEKP